MVCPPPGNAFWDDVAKQGTFTTVKATVKPATVATHDAMIFDWTSRYAKFRGPQKTEEEKPTLEQVLQSFKNSTNPGKGSGISGASFFLSEDSSLIAKSIDDREVRKAVQLANVLSETVTNPSLLVPVWYMLRFCNVDGSNCEGWIVSPTINGERKRKKGKFDVKAGGKNTVGIDFGLFKAKMHINTMAAEDGIFTDTFPKGLVMNDTTLKELQDRLWVAKQALDGVEVYDYSLMITLSEQQNCTGMRGVLVMDDVMGEETESSGKFQGCVAIGIIDQYSNWGQTHFENTGQAKLNSQAYSKNMIKKVAGMMPSKHTHATWEPATEDELSCLERYFHVECR